MFFFVGQGCNRDRYLRMGWFGGAKSSTAAFRSECRSKGVQCMIVFSPDSLINQKISNVQKPEWPNFFYFVPENKVLPFAQMNSQSADPHGSLGYFLYQPGI